MLEFTYFADYVKFQTKRWNEMFGTNNDYIIDEFITTTAEHIVKLVKQNDLKGKLTISDLQLLFLFIHRNERYYYVNSKANNELIRFIDLVSNYYLQNQVITSEELGAYNKVNYETKVKVRLIIDNFVTIPSIKKLIILLMAIAYLEGKPLTPITETNVEFRKNNKGGFVCVNDNNLVKLANDKLSYNKLFVYKTVDTYYFDWTDHCGVGEVTLPFNPYSVTITPVEDTVSFNPLPVTDAGKHMQSFFLKKMGDKVKTISFTFEDCLTAKQIFIDKLCINDCHGKFKPKSIVEVMAYYNELMFGEPQILTNLLKEYKHLLDGKHIPLVTAISIIWLSYYLYSISYTGDTVLDTGTGGVIQHNGLNKVFAIVPIAVYYHGKLLKFRETKYFIEIVPSGFKGNGYSLSTIDDCYEVNSYMSASSTKAILELAASKNMETNFDKLTIIEEYFAKLAEKESNEDYNQSLLIR